MSPILHDIGLIASYGSYILIIHRVVADCLLKLDQINILVAGVDSESSAKELLHALEIFGPMCSVTFADHCRTPLARIEKALDGSDADIRTKCVDLLESTWGAQFDLVLADSFLKQFGSERRVSVLNQIARFVKKGSGRLLLREYCGSSANHLVHLWDRLDQMLTLGDATDLAHSLAQQPEFRTMVDELDRHYRNTGSFYPDRGALRSDVNSSSWQVINQYSNVGASHEIIVAVSRP
jgi:hypothetical protein